MTPDPRHPSTAPTGVHADAADAPEVADDASTDAVDDATTPAVASDPLLAPVRTTPWERLRDRVLGIPRNVRLLRWLVPLVITVIAGILRFWNLAHPHTLIFDETYYVKDAWTLLHLGYEAVWPEGANESFLAGDTDVFGTDGSFIAHPPLGKWIIALGMLIFGADSGFGWRATTALMGTLTVLVLYLVAKRLTGSIVFAGIAAGLLAIDGLGIVMSRVVLLDGSLAFFVLLGFLFVLLDRERSLGRVEAAVGGADARWGPVFWRRPWLLAAGATLGAATAVKWSGLYVLAAVGIYLVVTDALARRRAGVVYWPMDAAVRQGPITFLLLVPIAAVVYLASWTGWLVTDGGWGRGHSSNAFASLWHYHEQIYRFHVGLSTPHGYQSPAWEWPLLGRPTGMYWSSTATGPACDAPSGCVEVMLSLPNPLIWYAGVAAALFLVWRFAVTRQWRYAFVLVGIAATYVPWLLYPERTIFQFYTVVILPFLILALVFALRWVSGSPDASTHRRESGQGIVVVFLGVAVVLSAFYYPLWTGMEIPDIFYRIHMWSPRWI